LTTIVVKVEVVGIPDHHENDQGCQEILIRS